MKQFTEFVSELLFVDDLPGARFLILQEYADFRRTGILSNGILRLYAQQWIDNLGVRSVNIAQAAMQIAEEIALDIAIRDVNRNAYGEPIEVFLSDPT